MLNHVAYLCGSGFLAVTICNFSINTSTSLPFSAFLIIKSQKALGRGDYVAFYPALNPLYRSDILFIKRISGVAVIM